MTAAVSERSSSLHRTTSSTPGYFEFNPSTQSDNALIQSAMDPAHVHRLDAFHKRPVTSTDLPANAHIYAARPLPPVPVPALRSPASVKDIKSIPSVAANRRPSLSASGRTATTDCIERSLPPLPFRAAPHHRRGLSIESVACSDASESQASTSSRPRTMRSISFRNFLNRNTYPQTATPIPESPRTSSSLSHSSTDSTRDSRHDSVVDDMGLSHSKTTTPASSTAGSRRPSTLSLTSLRPRKISQESVPSLPTPRPISRKESSGASNSRRWNPFSHEKTQITIEDGETSPGMPVTPPGSAELSCHRCYYFSMRNCNGWVMGGSHGDACENCTMHGFFGSP